MALNDRLARGYPHPFAFDFPSDVRRGVAFGVRYFKTLAVGDDTTAGRTPVISCVRLLSAGTLTAYGVMELGFGPPSAVDVWVTPAVVAAAAFAVADTPQTSASTPKSSTSFSTPIIRPVWSRSNSLKST